MLKGTLPVWVELKNRFSRCLHELLTVSFSGWLPGKKDKNRSKPKTSGAVAPGEASLRYLVRVCSRLQGRGGQVAGVGPHPLLRSPASGSHLVPAAPQSGGRDLPPQWPRARHEAGGEAAGAAGRIFPPGRRRRRARYHGDRSGRAGLGGSRPPAPGGGQSAAAAPAPSKRDLQGHRTDPQISQESTGKGRG